QEAIELEIKRTYHKLSLQHHPEKNDNSSESQSKFREVQAAYELLITGLPNYQVYFGVSEEEIKGLSSEEITDTFDGPDLKNSLEILAVDKITISPNFMFI
ncbi:4386_t:CDS:1, partial [Ambispora gerdemannii]